MNDFLLSGLLGVVEGLTEFRPVSSTAHLRIAEAFAHIDLTSGYWKMYTIIIQLGAILCLPVYFRKEIKTFLSTFPRKENRAPYGAHPPPRTHRGGLRGDGDPGLLLNFTAGHELNCV
jgi:undecaprenyl pyrophosphate phosphatase UppP